MFRRILLVVNPVTLFLLINILASSQTSAYEEFTKLERIDYINVGSSHGERAFDYRGTSYSINLGFGSQRLFYGLRILESIEHKLTTNSVIIIPVSIFSFCGSFDGSKQRYLGFMSRNELGITYAEEVLYKHFSFLGINKTEAKFNKLLNQDTLFLDNGIDTAHYHLRLSQDCGVIDNNVIKQLNNFVSSNIDKRIIILITPYYKSYWDEILSEEKISLEFYNTIYQIVKEHSLEFLDYSSDVRFNTNDFYFSDSDHMNTIGALEFTKIVIEELSTTTKITN